MESGTVQTLGGELCSTGDHRPPPPVGPDKSQDHQYPRLPMPLIRIDKYHRATSAACIPGSGTLLLFDQPPSPTRYGLLASPGDSSDAWVCSALITCSGRRFPESK